MYALNALLHMCVVRKCIIVIVSEKEVQVIVYFLKSSSAYAPRTGELEVED